MTTDSNSTLTPFSKFSDTLSQKSALRFRTNPLGSPSRRPPPPTRPSFLSESNTAKTSLLRPTVTSTPVNLNHTESSTTATRVRSTGTSSDRKSIGKLSNAYNSNIDGNRRKNSGHSSGSRETTIPLTSTVRDDGSKSSICVKDLEQTVEDLRKENFDIKLRLFHFEENIGRKRSDNGYGDGEEEENSTVTKNAKPVNELFEENGKLKVELTRTATVMQNELQEAYDRIHELEAYASTQTDTNVLDTERELRDAGNVYFSRTRVEFEESQEHDRLYQEVTGLKSTSTARAQKHRTIAESAEDIVQNLQIASGTRRQSTLPHLCEIADDRRTETEKRNDTMDHDLAEHSAKKFDLRENSCGEQRIGTDTEGRDAVQQSTYSRIAFEGDKEGLDTRCSSESDFVLVDTGDLDHNEEFHHPAISNERCGPHILGSPSTAPFRSESSVLQRTQESAIDGLDSSEKYIGDEFPGDGNEQLLTEGSFHIDDPFPQLGNDWDGDPEKPFLHGTEPKEPTRDNLNGFTKARLPPVCIEEHVGQSTPSGSTIASGTESNTRDRKYAIRCDGSRINANFRWPILPDPISMDEYPSLFRPIETPRMVTFGGIYTNPPERSPMCSPEKTPPSVCRLDPPEHLPMCSPQKTPPSVRRLVPSHDDAQSKQTSLDVDNPAYTIYPCEATKRSPFRVMTDPPVSTRIPTPTYHTPYTRARRQTTNPSYNRRSPSLSSCSSTSSGSQPRSSLSFSPTTSPSRTRCRRKVYRKRERASERIDVPRLNHEKLDANPISEIERSKIPEEDKQSDDKRCRLPSGESRGEFDFVEDVLSRIDQLEKISNLLQDQLSVHLGQVNRHK